MEEQGDLVTEIVAGEGCQEAQWPKIKAHDWRHAAVHKHCVGVHDQTVAPEGHYQVDGRRVLMLKQIDWGRIQIGAITWLSPVVNITLVFISLQSWHSFHLNGFGVFMSMSKQVIVDELIYVYL